MSTYAATYSPNAYRASAVLTASPGQLVVMLYDGARRFLHQAAVAMAEGQIVLAHNKLTRAEDIIRHLRSTLDSTRASSPSACSRSTRSRCRICARLASIRTPRRSSRSLRCWAGCVSRGPRSPIRHEPGAGGPVRDARLDDRARADARRRAQLRRAAGAQGAPIRAAELVAGDPPAAARPALERCRMLHKRVEIELLRVREALLLELGRVRHAQRAADGYAPARRRRRARRGSVPDRALTHL